MIAGKYPLFFALVISAGYMSSCISLEPVILHGDISGNVTDAETSEPVQGALIELRQEDITADSTRTGNDGSYLLKNITPGDYEIQASKFAYGISSKKVKVDEATTGQANFTLSGIPIQGISNTYLDFGLDLTTLSFTITNSGKKKLVYSIITSQDDWITVDPFSGDVGINQTDTITVTINKKSLSDTIIYKERIEITSAGGPAPLQDTIGIYLNGVMDARDLRFYKTVKIGAQTWMAENLDVGEQIEIYYSGRDNGIIEKFCYYDQQFNCELYGGIYDWEEAMQYNTSDSGKTGTTRGICPEGWHIPTNKEWQTLIDYLGGAQIAGGKLKETGTRYWNSPNEGATNETGFRALPGGYIEGTGAAGTDVLWSYEINTTGTFWTATIPPDGAPILGADIGSHIELSHNTSSVEIKRYPDRFVSCSVRCIKDPF